MNEIEIKKTEENIKEASLLVEKESRDLYIKFMTKRFGGNYQTLNYCLEWAKRFESSPTPFMDLESLKIYEDIKWNI